MDLYALCEGRKSPVEIKDFLLGSTVGTIYGLKGRSPKNGTNG